jgi:hypothetical protein
MIDDIYFVTWTLSDTRWWQYSTHLLKKTVHTIQQYSTHTQTVCTIQQYSTHLHTNSTLKQQYSTHLHTDSIQNTAVQHTFTHKLYTEQHIETDYIERNIHNNKHK